jgi:hypothetical protein
MRPSKTFATASVLFVLGASGLVFTHSLPPCTSDDGANAPCYWDAQTMGNGAGHSFVAQIADVAQPVSLESLAEPTIDQLSVQFPDISVYWSFAPDASAQYWGLTYCTNTATDNTPVVILDNDVSHYTAEQLAHDIPTLVRHEFGHVLMCHAGMDSLPQDEKERLADAVADSLTPAGETRAAFYTQTFTAEELVTAAVLVQ